MVSIAQSSQCEKINTFVCHQDKLVCQINPLVYMTILDAFARRPRKPAMGGGYKEERESRVIGTLMGYISEGNVLDVVDCFQVIHQDSTDRGVLMDQQYHRRMVGLRQSVHPKEVVIGWFSCGDSDITDDTVSIQSYYRTKESLFTAAPGCPNPIYLQIDTQLRQTNAPIGVKVYTNTNTPCCESLMQFHQIPVAKTNMGYENEKNIMEMLLQTCLREAQTQKKPAASEMDAFSRNLSDLKALFEKAKTYVDQVLEGKAAPNPEVGRALSRVLSADLLADPAKLDAVCTGATKDTLMVMYLSALARTQIGLAEKIGLILQSTTENNH